MSAVGSYVSVAGALSGADESVKHVIKMGFLTSRPDESADPNALEIAFSTDHILLDFNSLVASDFNVKKIVKDCDFVKEIALRNPDKLK
jgi:hypothetical protein